MARFAIWKARDLTETLYQVILHTVVHHSSTSTYMPNFIEIEESFLWTYGRTDGHLRWSALLGRLRRRVDLKCSNTRTKWPKLTRKNTQKTTNVRTTHKCVHIIVHNCCIQHSTEQFWLSSLLSSTEAPELRSCLLEGRGTDSSECNSAIDYMTKGFSLDCVFRCECVSIWLVKSFTWQVIKCTDNSHPVNSKQMLSINVCNNKDRMPCDNVNQKYWLSH